MPPPPEEEVGSLGRVREGLYAPQRPTPPAPPPLARGVRSLPHLWAGAKLPPAPNLTPKHTHLATRFFIAALVFFITALSLAGYLLYFGGNTVSVKNIDLAVQGPSTIAGGDTVPLTIAVTNRNPVAVQNATLEVDFPAGTRSADDVLSPMPVYSENLGTLASGETVTRSVRAIIFGAAGATLTLPVSFTYSATGSNSTFVKKSSYPLAISSTPLSISVDTATEAVPQKPFTITLQVRSNATVPIDNVLVAASFPSGFSLTSSSIPATAGSSFLLGTLAPGDSKTVTLTGTLDGQDGDERVLHFTIGTGKSAGSSDVAVSYMEQDASLTITAPFIQTSLTLNGSSLASATLAPGKTQSVTLSYTNTLSTNLTNASIAVALSGGAVDYSSVRTTNGFYRSSDHTILFSSDTDPALASLAPGASGVGSFTFTTLSGATFGQSPSVTFTTSVSGTRVGQSNVPEAVTGSVTQTVKASTAVILTASSNHSSGPFSNTGPIPPKADSATTYAVTWRAQDTGSAVADGTVSATLPSYATYTGITSGQGSLHYDSGSRTVTWSVGDLAQGASAQASFQVSLKPSTSQKGTVPALTSSATFAGFDRFASVSVTASADPVTTETKSDPGYSPSMAAVQ